MTHAVRVAALGYAVLLVGIVERGVHAIGQVLTCIRCRHGAGHQAGVSCMHSFSGCVHACSPPVNSA